MKLQQFVLVLDRLPTKEQIEALSHHDDLAVYTCPRQGTAEVAFDRDASALVDAVLTAVRDLDQVGLPAVRVRDDDDLVTLGVVAERIGRSREAVRLWSIGRTGPGGFPPPASVSTGSSLYRWSQVAPWLRERMGFELPDPEPVLAAVNLALQLRAMAPRLSRWDAIRALLAA
jgi:hypothetical protein